MIFYDLIIVYELIVDQIEIIIKFENMILFLAYKSLFFVRLKATQEFSSNIVIGHLFQSRSK